MNSASRRLVFASAVTLTLLLAGCVPTASTPGTAGSSEGGSDAGTEASTGSGSSSSATADCSVFKGATDPELVLFTSSAIAAGPTEGQVYGDGSTFSVTLTQEALAAGLLPQAVVNNISPDGAPLWVSSPGFDPTTGGDGTFSTMLPAFGNDELVGKAVVMEIFAISDAKVEGAQQYGDKLLLGNFCMTYANDGS